MKIQPVGIFGRSVPPGSPNPDPILDNKTICHFSHPPISDPAFKTILKLHHHYLD